jgi:tetratricopeptide (TPR) repeat protein
VGELETLTLANPMRERLWSQRMLALYRCGRQAEALRVYHDLRSILVDELGIEPGHDVTWLEHAILAQDPALDYLAPPERSEDASDAGPRIAEPVPEYRPRVPIPIDEGPLVGREHESAALAEWWETVRGSYARFLLVDGDSGIGKTRLVAELARRAESDGALVLWGRCDEEPIAPFQPFAEALGRYFQSLSADQISRMPEWQLSELSRLVVRLREYAPAPEDDTRDPESDRFRFFEAVTATLNELAGTAPLLLVLDDLHRADQPTLLLLRHVLRNLDRDNLGIVGIYIDTEVPPDHRLRAVLSDFRVDRRVGTVNLRGLRREAVEELVRTSGAPTGLVTELFVLTDGNPLFLEEMIRQLTDSPGIATREDDSAVPHNLNPPEAIRELVARRVSRLPEDVIYLLQAGAVAGLEFEAGIVAEAADLGPDQRLDALDRAEESRLLRPVGETGERYAFSHALVREAIYGEMLRGRQLRSHHEIAVATEHAYGDDENHVNELAHHFYMGSAVAEADKAIRYCLLAGERALHLLAFEEAVGHFTRSLEVAERFGEDDPCLYCDVLLALAEAQNRAGDVTSADVNFERAAALARTLGDAERLATAALRAGPLSYVGIIGASEGQECLLEEARALLPEEDSQLRAMVTARLGVVLVYASGVPGPEARARALALNTEAVSMARRLSDPNALGYALNARMHVLCEIAPSPERLATGAELEEIADDVGDHLLTLHNHMWRIRELLAQGDVDAVDDEIERFAQRNPGPVHPLARAYTYNVEAMTALVDGDFETADRLGPLATEVPEVHAGMALRFYGALMMWTWWQRGDLAALGPIIGEMMGDAASDYPVLLAALALVHAEAAQPDEAMAVLDRLAVLEWVNVAEDPTEGMSLAMAAAACGTIGSRSRDHATNIYEQLRPYAGTAVVVRAPVTACFGPADQYLGLLAAIMGDLALAEVHFEAALRLARRMRSAPFAAAAEVELARTLRQRGRGGEEERVAVLLRHAEEAGVRMGLPRIARMAAYPG